MEAPMHPKDTTIPMYVNGEESPAFREHMHVMPAPSQPQKDMMMMKKPHHMTGRLLRDDSTSSTIASTLGTSSELRASLNASTTSTCKGITCEVKEQACDGDWLCQLQYRLYSREEEEAMLVKSYLQSRRPASFRYNKAELCLISGAAGLGKSRLARTLQLPVEEEGGYFISAKFDQVRQARPTRVFSDAFTEFTHKVIARGEEAVEATRRDICEALGDELDVLLMGCPVLEKIVGKPKREVQFTCQMAKRFVFALQDLVGAVCTAQTPMVLLFDDLQWLDFCSCKLLKGFLSCNQNRHLYIVGTCDDSVGPHSPVSGLLRELEDENRRQIFQVEVAQKPCKIIKEIIVEAVPMPEGRFDALGKLVCAQTQGNPLYIVEFLRWLSDEKLLEYDAATGTWILHDDDVRLSINACRLGDFLVDKLEQLPRGLQEVIRVAACLGNEVNEELLKVVFPADTVTDQLHEATSRGVLVFSGSGYTFRHDGLQNAALALIPEHERESLRLQLGRKMLKGLSEKDREKHIYLILGQLRMGQNLIQKPEEKEAVAILCLKAGQASAKASAFGAAASYLGFGIEMMDEDWGGDYSLKLALYNAAAEMELTVSNYERVHELLAVVFDNVPNLKHKLQAYNTLIYAYGVTDQQHLAVAKGIEVLEQLGETFPKKNCMGMLKSEMRKVERLLKGKSNAQIMRMEMIKTEEKMSALQILNILLMNVAVAKPCFAPFVQLKMVEITMKHGLSALASVAFASYGMLCTAVGKFDESNRYGQLSLDLLKQFRSKEYLPRVFAAVYGCITAWQRPIREAIMPLKKAQEVGSQTGDIEFSILNASLYSSAVFFSDSTLKDVSNLIENIINTMSTRRQDSLLVMIKPFHQLTLNLMGLSATPQCLKKCDDAFKAAESCGNSSSLLCLRLQNMMLGYLFGNYEQAGRMVAEIEGLAYPPMGIDGIFGKFFIGMTHLASARIYKGVKRIMCLNKAKKAIKEFKTWSLNAPHNCLPMKFLLEAELASLQGKNKRAYEKYTASTALAVDASFRMVEAMSHEHVGRHLFSTGEEALAAASFRKALDCYEAWGAKAKLQHLEDEVHEMFSGSSVQYYFSELQSHHFLK